MVLSLMKLAIDFILVGRSCFGNCRAMSLPGNVIARQCNTHWLHKQGFGVVDGGVAAINNPNISFLMFVNQGFRILVITLYNGLTMRLQTDQLMVC